MLMRVEARGAVVRVLGIVADIDVDGCETRCAGGGRSFLPWSREGRAVRGRVRRHLLESGRDRGLMVVV